MRVCKRDDSLPRKHQQPPFQKYKRERDRANIAGLGSSGEPLAGDTVGTHGCSSTRSILARHTDATSRLSDGSRGIREFASSARRADIAALRRGGEPLAGDTVGAPGRTRSRSSILARHADATSRLSDGSSGSREFASSACRADIANLRRSGEPLAGDTVCTQGFPCCGLPLTSSAICTHTEAGAVSKLARGASSASSNARINAVVLADGTRRTRTRTHQRKLSFQTQGTCCLCHSTGCRKKLARRTSDARRVPGVVVRVAGCWAVD